MQLVFTRLDQRRYVSRITRTDRVSFLVNGVGHMFQIPHDLAHYAIESALPLARGFWGSVADGAVFPSMTHIDGRRRPRAKERSTALLKSNAAHLSEAEILVRLFSTAFETDQGDVELGRLIADRGGVFQKPSNEQIARVRAALLETKRQWQNLPIGGELQLNWPA